MENNYSAKWKKRGTRQGLLRNALLKTMGYTDEDIEKPLVGIALYADIPMCAGLCQEPVDSLQCALSCLSREAQRDNNAFAFSAFPHGEKYTIILLCLLKM